MSVQVKGSGTIGGLDEGLNIVGVVTATSFDGNITGTVGVGTDNPQSVLHVANANTTVWPFSESVSTGPAYTPYSHELVIDNDVSNVTGSFAGIYFNAGGYATTSSVSRVSTARIAAIDTGDYKADLAFSTRGFGNSNHKEHLRIESGGNIGIGTINPATKLHVITDQSSSTPLTLERTHNNNVSVQYKSPTLTMFAGIAGEGMGWGVGTEADLGLESNNKLMVKPDGKIGIGITNPILDLQIAGNYGIGKTSSNGSYGYFVPYNGATGNMEFHLNWPGGSTESIRFYLTNHERMRISPEGYVTKPEHPYFNARTTPTAGSPNIHSFGVVMSNNGGHYNNSNGRFTAPVAGFYHFSFGIWCNASGDNTSKHLQLMRYINSSGNTTAIAGANHITQYNNLNGSAGTHLEVGDYVYLHQTGLTIQASTPRNFFSGHLVA